MREELVRLLSELVEGKMGIREFERWVILNLHRYGLESDPLVREAFRALDVLLLCRAAGEADDNDVLLAADGWLRRLRTYRLEVGKRAGTGSDTSTFTMSWRSGA